jgi:hypothetical protein
VVTRCGERGGHGHKDAWRHRAANAGHTSSRASSGRIAVAAKARAGAGRDGCELAGDGAEGDEAASDRPSAGTVTVEARWQASIPKLGVEAALGDPRSVAAAAMEEWISAEGCAGHGGGGAATLERSLGSHRIYVSGLASACGQGAVACSCLCEAALRSRVGGAVVACSCLGPAKAGCTLPFISNLKRETPSTF